MNRDVDDPIPPPVVQHTLEAVVLQLFGSPRGHALQILRVDGGVGGGRLDLNLEKFQLGTLSQSYISESTEGLSLGPAVPANEFPSLDEVVLFAASSGVALATEIAEVWERRHLAAREADRRGQAVGLDAIAKGREALCGIRNALRFNLVIIEREPLLSEVIVRRIWGAEAIIIDGVSSTYGGCRAFELLSGSSDYQLHAKGGDGCEGEWAVFVQVDPISHRLPIHFFTIVLNGEPFIRHHELMLAHLPFPWHWHVVEGVAELVKDSSWSVARGGKIPAHLNLEGMSIDGTTAYIDDVARRFIDNITVYRKPEGQYWQGKIEMVNRPLSNICEACILWQIDSDELWTSAQVSAARDMFLAAPDRSAAFFWCNFFVGPDRGISTRYNYAQNPQNEWLRAWRFQPGMVWDKHAPPVLTGRDAKTGAAYDVGRRNPFTHQETEREGLVFDHFAYATESQVAFKEIYYGYTGAVQQWWALQASDLSSQHLRDYFAWITDETMFEETSRLGWRPLARVDDTETWVLHGARQQEPDLRRSSLRILIDGIFFQIANTGIARLWTELLRSWVRSGFAEHIVFLDRGGSAPRIDGITYRSIDPHPLTSVETDLEDLQRVCDEENATLFISTYYTTPLRTPMVFMAYDMIPEQIGVDLEQFWWSQKRRAIEHAVGHIAISKNTADDLAAFHDYLDRSEICVVPCAPAPIFQPCSETELAEFRDKYGLEGPYVLLVGDRTGWCNYKNGAVCYAALAQLKAECRPLLVCVGGAPELEAAGRALLPTESVRLLRLDDADLRLAYGAAFALICPSLYEGFGLPVAEAMAVGCPVIASNTSSLPEVAGDAALYFDPRQPSALAGAISRLTLPECRQSLIANGYLQVERFNQDRSAADMAAFLRSVASDLVEGRRRSRPHLIEAHRLQKALASARQGRQEDSMVDGGRQMLSIANRVHGLDDLEGPYPADGLPNAFRWQISSSARVSLGGAGSAKADLTVRFANIVPGQKITLLENGKLRACLFPRATHAADSYSVSYSVVADAEIEIIVEKFAPGGHRRLYLAIYDVLVRFY